LSHLARPLSQLPQRSAVTRTLLSLRGPPGDANNHSFPGISEADRSMDRQHAHQLLDQLDPGQLAAIGHLLEVMVDPVACAVAAAPRDDEPVSEGRDRPPPSRRKSMVCEARRQEHSEGRGSGADWCRSGQSPVMPPYRIECLNEAPPAFRAGGWLTEAIPWCNGNYFPAAVFASSARAPARIPLNPILPSWQAYS
jgi:hypothetical protein